MSEPARIWELVGRASDPIPAEERDALSVLADAWLAAGHPEGALLACALAEPGWDMLSESGFASARAFEVAAEVRKILTEVGERDIGRAVRWLAELQTRAIGEPLHAPVAAYLFDMLHRIERRELAVVEYGADSTFHIENGWRLGVFVRVYAFWRIDRVRSPEGHSIELIDFASESPLGVLNQYEPPEDVEGEVYGLGYTPKRVWR